MRAPYNAYEMGSIERAGQADQLEADKVTTSSLYISRGT